MTPRIVRQAKPERVFKRHNYRSAFAFLKEEFASRCAYSDVPIKAIGDVAMHIDHFDPRKKTKYIQDYYNLLLSHSHCNLSKGDFWPNPRQAAKGFRVINPCAELDFGQHVFECPATRKLWGATPDGRFHIVQLDLNNEYFVGLRKERAKIEAQLTHRSMTARTRSSISELESLIATLKSMLDFLPRRFAEKKAPQGYRFH
jgi:hypothetical protein